MSNKKDTTEKKETEKTVVENTKEQRCNECDSLKQQMSDYKNKYLRALADYQNLEKRISQERDGLTKNANKYFILKLLPFLDTLDQAEVFLKDKGLQMAKDNFKKILAEMGVTEIEVLDKPFDPYTAEVIDIKEGDKDNIVIEVLRKGYKLFDQILRVAQVKVSRKVTS